MAAGLQARLSGLTGEVTRDEDRAQGRVPREPSYVMRSKNKEHKRGASSSGVPGVPLQVPGLVLDPTSMSMAAHTP